jgi:aldose 1-epimerase
MPSSILSRDFGRLPDGRRVRAYTLRGPRGLEVEVLDYGGIVTRVLVPDAEGGGRTDVVLGFSRLEPYLERHPYFGAIAGRVAGRIRAGRLTLDGRTCALTLNEGAHHLHGGAVGFDRRLWDAASVVSANDGPALRLHYRSPDGEEGYPGTLEASATISVTAENALAFAFEATADRPTVFSPTHHGYFNLAGEGSGSIEDHALELRADGTLAVDEAMTHTGVLEPLAGRPEDFTRPRRLGDVLPTLPGGHGALYALRRDPPGLQVAARLTHPESGRVLTVATDEPCLQVYSGVHLDGSLTGKSGRAYGRFAGICLECEGFPEGAMFPEHGDIVVRPGKPRRTTTEYRFSHEGAPDAG